MKKFTPKEILVHHKNTHPGVKIVKVTTTRYYEIPRHSGTDSAALMKEWFEDFAVTSSHAFRDGSLLIHDFNNDAKIIDPEQEL